MHALWAQEAVLIVVIFCDGIRTYARLLDAGFWICAMCGKRVKVVW